MFQNLRINFKLFIEVQDSGNFTVSKTRILKNIFLNNDKLRLNNYDLPMASIYQQLYKYIEYFLGNI